MQRWILLAGVSGLVACSFPTENFRVGAVAPQDVPVVDAPADDRPDVVASSDARDVATTDDAPEVPDVPATGDAGCAAGEALCGGSCVDTARSTQHCGECDRACDRTNATAVACAAGRCQLTCREGFADCDMDPRNGCETSLGTTTNCGRCRNECPAPAGDHRVAACVMGACAAGCAAGFGDCDRDPANGCEAALDTPTHCGRCGNACRAHPGSPLNACAMGACAPTCAPGFADCDRDPANGCEAALGTNANCARCGDACAGLCAMGGTDFACTPNTVAGYAVSMQPGAFVDVCVRPSSTKVLMGVDDAAASATMPFAFRYWAGRATQHVVQISANGSLAFDAAGPTPLTGILPSPQAPNGVVAPWWIDLRTSATYGVCHEAIGTAPNRRWIVQWRDATYYGDPGSALNFEVAFVETSNVIEFSYAALPAPPAPQVAAVGIESPTGAAAVAVCNPSQERCAVGTAQTVRFTPM